MSIDPYTPNEKTKSQKPTNDDFKRLAISQKREIDNIKTTLKKFLELLETQNEEIALERLEKLIKFAKKTKPIADKFIKQQQLGKPKLNLDVNQIKYLRDIEKMTFEEIAKKYNVSRNTIRNRYYNN